MMEVNREDEGQGGDIKIKRWQYLIFFDGSWAIVMEILLDIGYGGRECSASGAICCGTGGRWDAI